MTTAIQINTFNIKQSKHNMPRNNTLILIFHFVRVSLPEAESIIPPLCQWTPAALLPAALPHTASSGPSDTYAGCRGPVWSSWRSAGGGWPGGTLLSASGFPDHCDVWPRAIINHTRVLGYLLSADIKQGYLWYTQIFVLSIMRGDGTAFDSLRVKHIRTG